MDGQTLIIEDAGKRLKWNRTATRANRTEILKKSPMENRDYV
jgi:hypothetical protein